MAGPWEDYQSTEADTSAGPWNEYKPADQSKYANHPKSTFAAEALNALTFGLPDYLSKTFTPETYAEGQKYKAANPAAASAGQIAGDVAGLAIPAVGGAVKGFQYGPRIIEAGAKRFAPELAAGTAGDIAKFFGRAQGAATGGFMGAQLGAAAPDIIQSNPAQAVAKSELVNQYAKDIPYINPLPGPLGHAVPAVAGALADYKMPGLTQLKEGYQRLTAPQAQPSVATQPPTASNYLERMMEISKRFGL